MSAHGTRQRYGAGCRCADCKEAQRLYQRRYLERKANGETRPQMPVTQLPEPKSASGAVEAAVEAELAGLTMAETRPALAATVLALARVLDNPRATSPHPAAAAKLVDILELLRKGSDQRKSRLASVKEMTRPVVKTGS